MKIAFIVKSFPALSEKFILDQITGLLDFGHKVDIFASLKPEQPEVHDNYIKYTLQKRTHYISSIPQNKFLRIIKTILLIFIYFFQSPKKVSNALIFRFKNGEGFSYLNLYYSFLFIRRDFDIINCHFGPAGKIGVFLKCIGIQGKIVTAFHGYDVTSYIKASGNSVYKSLFQFGDLFTYNSESTRAKILTLGCPADRITKIPMGIDIEKIKYKERAPDSHGCINILSVGRLVEMKGREFAIKAVAEIVKKNPKVNYDIIGDGELRVSLQHLIDKLNVQDNIHIHGWVSTKELQKFYDSAHIFLHPSIVASDGNMEGQGVVLLEAQAAGIPIIATKHSAFPETVRDGISGFLVPEKNVDALIKKIEFLITNFHIWPTMGKKGREHAEKYDIRNLNSELERIFKNLL